MGALLLFSTRADANDLIRIDAGRVAFYYDTFLLEADGNVRVRVGSMSLSGDAFSMDLKLNRFVLAGHVHVSSPAGSQDGAALSDFFTYHRVYFVPVSSEPDRWTFLGDDFAHPLRGREMPGDAFALPNLTGSTAFLTGKSVVLEPGNFMRFGTSNVTLVGGTGLTIPLPSFYVNFGANQHLAENSLSGATYDATYQFAGGANAISAVHLRYDPTNKTYLSFEQHVASDKAYAVFSVNPATVPSKFFNLILSDQPDSHFQIRTFTQLHTFQSWLTKPLEASQFSNVLLTQSVGNASVQAYATFQNQSLLGRPPNGLYFETPEHTYNPDHIFYGNIGYYSGEFLHNKPLRFRFNVGTGYVYDGYQPLQVLRNVVYNRINQSYAGISAYTPALSLTGGHTLKDIYFNGIFNKELTWFSSPHIQDVTSTIFSVGRVLDAPASHVVAYAQYGIYNVADRYGDDLQRVAYPVITVQNGVYDPGYAAFQGLATFRTTSLGALYTNGPDFTASVLFRKHNDFPQAVPNFFTLPPTDIFGRYIYTPYFGEAPYDITPDVRFRVAPHMMIDISRTYYFNFGHQNWGPHWVIQVTQ